LIVDAFTYLGQSRDGWKVDRDELVRALDAESVAAAVLCPPSPVDGAFEAANEVVADAVAREPGRFVGIARVDPLLGAQAAREIERAARSLGLRGVFLHPWEDRCPLDRPEVFGVVECAVELGLPVMVAAGYPWMSEAAQVAELCAAFPAAKMIATNGAQINISGLGQIDAEALVARCPNVVLLTNGVYRDDFLAGVAAHHGAHRLAYGSGYPVMDMRFERRRVTMSTLSEDAQRTVSGTTAASLFGMASP
jgi:uncharacterized protein